jgi:hypothetical protein
MIHYIGLHSHYLFLFTFLLRQRLLPIQNSFGAAEQCEYMENFLCIAYIQLKVFRLFLYSMFKHGKIPIGYSMFKMLISNIMEIKRKFRPDSNLKLMNQVFQVLRYHHYAYRTEQTYCNRI